MIKQESVKMDNEYVVKQNLEQRNKRIKVIVDTNILIQGHCDFLGIRSQLIPLFYKLLQENGIQLLNHPILQNELKRHIADSTLYKDFTKAQKVIEEFRDNLLSKFFDDTMSIDTISDIDYHNVLYDQYCEFYKDAVILDYCSPKIVFEQWFECRPPFKKDGRKKNEFPDAFVIQAIKDYLKINREDIVMVLSADNDWKEALCNEKNIVLYNNIAELMSFINQENLYLNKKQIDMVVDATYADIKKLAEVELVNCYYYLDSIRYDNYDFDPFLVKMEKINQEVNTLLITQNKLLLRLKVNIDVLGSGEEDYIFYDNSRYYNGYGERTFDGKASVLIDVNIEYDINNLANSNVTDVSVVCDDDIPVNSVRRLD